MRHGRAQSKVGSSTIGMTFHGSFFTSEKSAATALFSTDLPLLGRPEGLVEVVLLRHLLPGQSPPHLLQTEDGPRLRRLQGEEQGDAVKVAHAHLLLRAVQENADLVRMAICRVRNQPGKASGSSWAHGSARLSSPS